MTEDSDEILDDLPIDTPSTPPYKLYDLPAIALAAYLGGPLAAGILLYKNYENLNNPSHARLVLTLGIIFTLLLACLVFIPQNIISKVPNVVIPGIYTGAIYLLAAKYLGPALQEHKAKQGALYSRWLAAGISIICLIVLLGIIILFSLFTD